MEEAWKPVVGYEGLYEVSDLGKVRNVGLGRNRVFGEMLRPQLNSRWGYWQVNLRDGHSKNPKTHRLHRVIALAFLGPVPAGHEVNHKDGDKGNNRLDNLEYCTPSQNHLHRIHVLGKKSKTDHLRAPGEKNGMAKLTLEQVEEIRHLLQEGAMSQVAIGEKFGVRQSTISKINIGKRWSVP